jgi:hypothetical protein
MKKLRNTGMLISVFALLITFAFITTAAAQRVPAGGGQGEKWVITTYTPDNGYTVPVPMPVTKSKGGVVTFDLFIHDGYPDRAMLITDITGKFNEGKLTGHSLSARIAINATAETTFNYCGTYCDGTDSGGFVRLYIQGTNPAAVGCESGWHPERPDCEAQYWWSNPLHIDLEALLPLGSQGITLQGLLSPENWSDRDGHVGTAVTTTDEITVDHAAVFSAVVANPTKMGLSFGGGNNFAFGVGANQSATFLLYDFSIK